MIKNFKQYKAYLAGGALLLAGMAGAAQAGDVPKYGLPTAKPESVGMSTERLERIAPVMKEFLDKGEAPGIVSVIARHGKVVHFEPQGYMDMAKKKPLKADSIYHLFSMSKIVTGVATLMMYEEGKFLLDDPLSDYLPYFKDMLAYENGKVVKANKPITIRMLMNHTSGINYDSTHVLPEHAGQYPSYKNEVMGRMGPVDLAGTVKLAAQVPLVHQPGERWKYGGGMMVMARLVEVLSGQSFGDFVRERIAKPLKLKDMDYVAAGKKGKRLANLMIQKEDGTYEPTPNHGGDYREQPTIEGGGTGLVGTVQDYLRFAQMLLNGGELEGVRLLSPTTVKLMMSDHLGGRLGETPLQGLSAELAATRGVGFGLTGMVVNDAIAAHSPGSDGEFSWAGWANTYFWIDPKEDLIALVFEQVINGNQRIRVRMQQMTYQAIIGE